MNNIKNTLSHKWSDLNIKSFDPNKPMFHEIYQN